MSRNKLRVSLKECREIHSKTCITPTGDIRISNILTNELFYKIDNHLNPTHYRVGATSQAGVFYYFKRPVKKQAPWEEDIFGH